MNSMVRSWTHTLLHIAHIAATCICSNIVRKPSVTHTINRGQMTSEWTAETVVYLCGGAASAAEGGTGNIDRVSHSCEWCGLQLNVRNVLDGVGRIRAHKTLQRCA